MHMDTPKNAPDEQRRSAASQDQVMLDSVESRFNAAADELKRSVILTICTMAILQVAVVAALVFILAP
jgi:nitrate reductase NapE component